jgi:photosystem II stability/assembly factor-like uncharacterized protein
MRKLLYIIPFLFIAFTFQSDNPPGWYQVPLPVNKFITDIFFVDSLRGWTVTNWDPQFDTAFIVATTDGGDNWSVQNKGSYSFTGIQFIDENTGYAVGGDGSAIIFKTTNSGLNWIQSIPFGSGVNSFQGLHFVSSDTGWVSSTDALGGGLWRTTNGGINWEQQLGASFQPNSIFFLNKDTGWTASQNTILYFTSNSGLNWSTRHDFTASLKDVFFATKDTGWLISGASPTGLLKTINSGINWNLCNNPQPLGDSKLFFVDSKHGWAGSGFGQIIATTDGENWGYQQTPNFDHYTVFFLDTLRGFTGGTNMLKTTDGGGPITSIHQISNEIPLEFELYQNYPNPFNPITSIKFKIRSLKNITLKVFDVTGKEIAVLVNEKLTAGEYIYQFDGSGLPSGVYFYKLQTEDYNDVKKMVLTK